MEAQNTPAGAMEKDPVCGMTVDPSRAKATHEHAGKTYYFCCAGCKEKFSADAAKYLMPKTLVGIAPMSARPVQIAPAAAHGASQPVVKIAEVASAARKAASNEYTCPNLSLLRFP
jgi:YHS domain-containing protein